VRWEKSAFPFYGGKGGGGDGKGVLSFSTEKRRVRYSLEKGGKSLRKRGKTFHPQGEGENGSKKE